MKQIDRKADFLSRVKINYGLSYKTLMKLSYLLKDRNLKRGHVLFKEGDIVDGIYFIYEGELEAWFLQHRGIRLRLCMLSGVSTRKAKQANRRVSATEHPR